MKESEKFNLVKFLSDNKIKSGTYNAKDLKVEFKNPYNDTKNKK